ncbi:MAG TPA: type II toxin-antitoxin system RelE/ParE family toxin [Candidatus Nanoarchaeia archaeon]|nr:type II toxin-antitoxin system RelE/ParE family toxin [Candidatus Nanoarchaeia archaeon]
MTWEIMWHPKAAKYVEILPPDLSARVLNKIDEVAENPFHYLEHFEGGGYKLRIGDYRAIVDVDFQQKILKIRIFDKRGRVYK